MIKCSVYFLVKHWKTLITIISWFVCVFFKGNDLVYIIIQQPCDSLDRVCWADWFRACRNCNSKLAFSLLSWLMICVWSFLDCTLVWDRFCSAAILLCISLFKRFLRLAFSLISCCKIWLSLALFRKLVVCWLVLLMIICLPWRIRPSHKLRSSGLLVIESHPWPLTASICQTYGHN